MNWQLFFYLFYNLHKSFWIFFLTLSTLTFASSDLSIGQLKAAPKAAAYSIELTDAKAHAYRSYNFGKVVIGSKTIVEYTITNKTSAPLAFVSGTRTSKHHIKGDHTCNNGDLAIGDSCTLYFYYAPTRWGNHKGKGIIEFAQDKRVVIEGQGKARVN